MYPHARDAVEALAYVESPNHFPKAVHTFSDHDEVDVRQIEIVRRNGGMVAADHRQDVGVPGFYPFRQELHPVGVDGIAGDADDIGAVLLESLFNGVINPLIEDFDLVVAVDPGRHVLEGQRFEEKHILAGHADRRFRRLDQQDSHWLSSLTSTPAGHDGFAPWRKYRS